MILLQQVTGITTRKACSLLYLCVSKQGEKTTNPELIKKKQKHWKNKIMKKLILTTAILLTAFAGAFAQSSADANLSVTINPIQTIQVNNANVNLNYSTTDHYKNGVTADRPNHLTVYSTGAFQVKVKASDLKATGTNTETIVASGITVTAANGSLNPLANLTTKGAVALPTTEAATIFTSTQGGVDRNVNVTYKGAGGDAYINKYFKTGSDNVYNTTVTYSIEAM